MSSPNKEHLSPKGKDAIVKETREKIRPVIKELTKKFDGLGFDKKDFGPAIQEGIDKAKNDV